MEFRYKSVIVSVDKPVSSTQDSMIKCVGSMLAQAIDNDAMEILMMWGIGEIMKKTNDIANNPTAMISLLQDLGKKKKGDKDE